MKRYKHLLLDADGTFYDFSACQRIALKKLFDYYNIPYIQDNIEIYNSINHNLWHLLEEGEIDIDQLKIQRMELLFDKFDLIVDAKAANDQFCALLGENGIMFPGARECIEKLKTKYTLTMITNGISTVQRGRFKSSNTQELYSNIIISEEIGYYKPDKRFFDYTLSSINAKKEECLIVGDSLTSDIQGGINSGIDTLYLYLNGEKKSGDYTYSANSYDSLIELLFNL